MKKILLVGIFACLPLSVTAFPGADFTVGGAPFSGLLQQSFERDELRDYEMFNRSNKTVEEQQLTEDELKQEAAKLQKFKKRTKIDLEHAGYSNENEINSPVQDDKPFMHFKNQNGKIFIKAD